jgi:phytoene synthase
MDLAEIEMLPTAQRLALAYLRPAERAVLEPAFALDFRLSRIVATSSEPILAQMRIAWWRDILGKPVNERPQGDAVLTKLTEHWLGSEPALHRLFDAWEELLLIEELDIESAERIAQGRGAFLAEVMQSTGQEFDRKVSAAIAMHWALADLAAHCSSDEERKLIVAVATSGLAKRVTLPSKLRGIAVLDALARHALKRGGRPLAEGRAGAFVALRAGLLGR